MIYLDTHVVVWLYLGDLSRISSNARNAIAQDDLIISPMVGLELQYLKEIGRLTTDGKIITDFLEKAIELRICDMPFQDIIKEANELSWTRDPFDRLIVGHATAAKCGLMTKDKKIWDHYPDFVW